MSHSVARGTDSVSPQILCASCAVPEGDCVTSGVAATRLGSVSHLTRGLRPGLASTPPLRGSLFRLFGLLFHHRIALPVVRQSPEGTRFRLAPNLGLTPCAKTNSARRSGLERGTDSVSPQILYASCAVPEGTLSQLPPNPGLTPWVKFNSAPAGLDVGQSFHPDNSKPVLIHILKRSITAAEAVPPTSLGPGEAAC